MKLTLRFILIACMAIFYSCNSNLKRQIIDSSLNKNLISNDSTEKKSIEGGKVNYLTKVVFPNYAIILHDFCVYFEHDGDKKSDYNGELSQVNIFIDEKKNWTLTAKSDTVDLPGGMTDDSSILEFVPNNKDDHFRISLAYNVDISEFNNYDNGVKTEVLTSYKPLKDSSNYFFKITEPLTNYRLNNINPGNIKEIKNKLSLKDTTIEYLGADRKKYKVDLVSYKGKACQIGSESIVHLKIERYNNDKLMDIRFLTISPVVDDDGVDGRE